LTPFVKLLISPRLIFFLQMIKVLVDLYRLKEVNSGLGYFSNQLSSSLIENQTEDLGLTFMIPNSRGSKFSISSNIVFASIFKMLFSRFNTGFDVWHSTSQFPKVYPGSKTKFILTIHDLNFLIEKPNLQKKAKYLKKLQNKVDRADAITSISLYTKTLIEEHISLKGKKVHVIHNGVESPELFAYKRPQWASNKKFFFSIGYFTAKKNWEVLIDMMTEFPDYNLIISGFNNTAYGKSCENLIKQKGLNDRIVLSGTISNEEKSWLYAECSAFLFPSLAEGFGMPAVEAMKLGKPVFLSKFTSLPEIGGDAAFYFDNFDKKSMKLKITSGLQTYNADRKAHEDKIKSHVSKFDWDVAAKKYIELYKSFE